MRKKKKISQIQDDTKPNWLGCVSMLGGFARHHRAIKITRGKYVLATARISQTHHITITCLIWTRYNNHTSLLYQ